VEKSSAPAPWSLRRTAESRLGSFGNRGNGHYRQELRQAVGAIKSYLATYQLPEECALLRLDGQYGTGAALAELAGFLFVCRGKDYTLLDHSEIQARLHLPPDQSFSRPESTLVRQLYNCASGDGGHKRTALSCRGSDPPSRVGEEPGGHKTR
jgi:hypothetical protein